MNTRLELSGYSNQEISGGGFYFIPNKLEELKANVYPLSFKPQNLANFTRIMFDFLGGDRYSTQLDGTNSQFYERRITLPQTGMAIGIIRNGKYVGNNPYEVSMEYDTWNLGKKKGSLGKLIFFHLNSGSKITTTFDAEGPKAEIDPRNAIPGEYWLPMLGETTIDNSNIITLDITPENIQAYCADYYNRAADPWERRHTYEESLEYWRDHI